MAVRKAITFPISDLCITNPRDVDVDVASDLAASDAVDSVVVVVDGAAGSESLPQPATPNVERTIASQVAVCCARFMTPPSPDQNYDTTESTSVRNRSILRYASLSVSWVSYGSELIDW